MRVGSRATPFIVGAAIAASAFGFFGWDLAHHYTAYSPHQPPSHWNTVVGLLPLAVILAVHGSRWLRTCEAASWPSAASRIESGSVRMVVQGRRGRPSYHLSVGYSYMVNGETYGGVHSELLDTEPEAESLLANLRASPPLVRYKLDDPMESEMLL